MSEQPTIRLANPEDVKYILGFIRELAEYEKALHEVEATEESLLATLTFPNTTTTSSTPSTTTPATSTSTPRRGAVYTALITPPSTPTTPSPIPVGMALYFYNYSTWRSAPGIYLEDLFVQPHARGKGYGFALLRFLARQVLECNGKRLEWSVLKWNEPSIRFYEDKVGARAMEDWLKMMVEGEEKLRELAEGI